LRISINRAILKFVMLASQSTTRIAAVAMRSTMSAPLLDGTLVPYGVVIVLYCVRTYRVEDSPVHLLYDNPGKTWQQLDQ
jgi:hypothetical protein